MRLQIIIMFIVFFSKTELVAQANGVVINGGWSGQVAISDVNGRPFENIYSAVVGSPYFDTAYKFSKIILSSGPKFTGIRAKINLVAQEIIFIDANGTEASMPRGMVKEISFSDTVAGKIIPYRFQTGYPAIDRQSKQNFYRVLIEGNCNFLQSIEKNISEKKNEMSGEVTKEFETYEGYYLFINGEIKRMKKDKDFILSVLSDKQQEVSQYVQLNKMNFKNADDVAKLIAYYNSLH